MMVLRVAISSMPVSKVSYHIWTYTTNTLRNLRPVMMHLVSEKDYVSRHTCCGGKLEIRAVKTTALLTG